MTAYAWNSPEELRADAVRADRRGAHREAVELRATADLREDDLARARQNATPNQP